MSSFDLMRVLDLIAAVVGILAAGWLAGFTMLRIHRLTAALHAAAYDAEQFYGALTFYADWTNWLPAGPEDEAAVSYDLGEQAREVIRAFYQLHYPDDPVPMQLPDDITEKVDQWTDTQFDAQPDAPSEWSSTVDQEIARLRDDSLALLRSSTFEPPDQESEFDHTPTRRAPGPNYKEILKWMRQQQS